MRVLVYAILLYVSLPVVFSIFPATQGYSEKLFGYVLGPFKDLIWGVINYIPKLVAIVVIVVMTRYLVRFLHFVTTEVEKATLDVPGFYPDWAKPTFNIVRFVVYAFMFIFVFPYLPGSDSPVFQGSAAKELGLILNTTVTIGYDAPWTQVQELLISAALDCPNIYQIMGGRSH